MQVALFEPCGVQGQGAEHLQAQIGITVLCCAWEGAAKTGGCIAHRVISIHNNPENMALPARFKHLRFQCADVDTVDITKFFAPSYSFIEEGRSANEGETVLFHPCGLYFAAAHEKMRAASAWPACASP